MNILQVNSSPAGSPFGAPCARLVERLRDADPGELPCAISAKPHPVLDEAALGALFTPPSSARRNRPRVSRSTMR
jgi:FMN-dependent NADH-azoreductase